MNISLHSLTVSSVSSSPFMAKNRMRVTSSIFSRHFSSVFYNVQSLSLKNDVFKHTLSSAIMLNSKYPPDTIKLKEANYQKTLQPFNNSEIYDIQICSFINCRSNNWNGGGIFIDTDNFWGDLFVSECNFINCSSTDRAGAIYARNYYFVSTKNCVVGCTSKKGGDYLYSKINGFGFKSYVNYTTAYRCSGSTSLIEMLDCKPSIRHDNFTKNSIKESKDSALVYIRLGNLTSFMQYSFWEENSKGTMLRFEGRSNDDVTSHSFRNLMFNKNGCNGTSEIECCMFYPVRVQIEFRECTFRGIEGQIFPVSAPSCSIHLTECGIEESAKIERDFVSQSECNFGNKAKIKLYEILSTGECLSRFDGLTEMDIFIMCIVIPIGLSIIIILTVLGIVLKPRWLCFCLYDADDPKLYCCCTENCCCCCCCHNNECCRCCYHEDICYCLSHPCWCDWEAASRAPEIIIAPKPKPKKEKKKESKEKVELITQEEAISQNMEPPVTIGITMPVTTVKTTMRIESQD